MPDVAKILGKELEEEFGIEGKFGKYKLTEKGLVYRSPYGWALSVVSMLQSLLTGQLKIEWTPKKSENVWIVYSHHIVPQPIRFYPNLFPYHETSLKRGMIFRTEEEAIQDMKDRGWL